jgi:hypothetical protein
MRRPNPIRSGHSSADPGRLDREYRNGGALFEDRDPGWDLLSGMQAIRSRPDVLAEALNSMGMATEGDEPHAN